MPAWSATCALGKSCAVITLMGSCRACMLRSVCVVTFLRGFAGGAPSGEWELCRTWWADGARVDGAIKRWLMAGSSRD